MSEWEARGTRWNGPKWLGMMITGFVIILMGIMLSVAESAMEEQSSFYPQDTSTGGHDAMSALAAIMVIIGIILIIGGAASRGRELEENALRQAAAEEEIDRERAERELEKQEIVNAVKSTIKVRCRYCGTLNEENEEKCDSCGAPL